MTTITITAETIAKLEAAGFNRWTKGNMDRLYINAKDLGLEVDYYRTGSISSATWQGEHISNNDARRLTSSKAYIDVKTGELHVSSSFDLFDMPTLEDKIVELLDTILAPEPEPEAETETEPEAEYVTIERAEDEVEVSRSAEFDRPVAISMPKDAHDKMQSMTLTHTTVAEWLTHDLMSAEAVDEMLHDVNHSDECNLNMLVVYQQTFAAAFLDEVARGASRDEAFVAAMDSATRTYDLCMRHLGGMIDELEQELDELTTDLVRQEVENWADARLVTDYDMDAVLAQLGEDTSSESIERAVNAHVYQDAGDREDFHTFLRMFGITDESAADEIMEAATFEHDGKLVFTASKLDAARHAYLRSK